MGAKVYKTTLFRSQASFEEQAVLKDGEYVDRPYRSNVAIESYSKGVALTAQDLTATSNKLQVDQFKGLLMYVDNIDKVQNKWDAANVWADEAGKRLAIGVDAIFLYEALSAVNAIDDGSIGGTSGYGIVATINNVDNIFSKINRKLDELNVPLEDRFLDMSPQFKDVLWLRLAGKESLLGDKTTEYGSFGRYGGLKLFLTNNLTGSARWVPANNPTNGDTITIDGITCKFVDTLSGTSTVIPEFHIGTTTANTITNMVAAITTPGTEIAEAATTGYQIPTAASLRKMQMWAAADGTTYIEIRVKGASYVTVTGSDVTDVWTTQYQIQHMLAGQGKPIDLVIQKEPNVEMASTVSAGKSGTNILPLEIFGVKTFYQGTYEILNVKLASSTY